MYRMTNNQIMKCKLSHDEESREKDWEQLIFIYLPEDFRLLSHSEIFFDQEELLSRGELHAHAGIHRCSVYFAHGLPGLMMKRVRKSKKHAEIDDAQTEFAPWWEEPLRTLLTLSQRMFVYYRLLAVRVERPNVCENELARVVLGGGSQSNISNRRQDGSWPEECRLQSELTSALYRAGPFADLFDTLVEKLHAEVEPSDGDQTLLVVAEALFGALKVVDLPNLSSELLRSLQVIQDAMNSGGSVELWAGAAADYRRWLRSIPLPDHVESSCVVQWLNLLPKVFKQIEEKQTPALVLNVIVHKQVLHDIDANDSTLFDRAQTDNPFDVLVDREWIRLQMLEHFEKENPIEACCHQIVVGLITGISWEKMREKFIFVQPDLQILPKGIRERMRERLEEWYYWRTHGHDPYRCDGTIEYEIPELATRDLLNGILSSWQKVQHEPFYETGIPQVGKVMSAGLFSVLLDDVFNVFKAKYKEARRIYKAKQAEDKKSKETVAK